MGKTGKTGGGTLVRVGVVVASVGCLVVMRVGRDAAAYSSPVTWQAINPLQANKTHTKHIILLRVITNLHHKPINRQTHTRVIPVRLPENQLRTTMVFTSAGTTLPIFLRGQIGEVTIGIDKIQNKAIKLGRLLQHGEVVAIVKTNVITTLRCLTQMD